MDDDLQAVAGSDGVSVHSGFPNPAAERLGQGAPLALDINRLLIKHPSSSYLFRVAGHRWTDQGIYDGDIAVIDRALRPQAGDIVIAWQNESLMLCRQSQLTPDGHVWGVITSIIHQYK